jgi:hypothetical protein
MTDVPTFVVLPPPNKPELYHVAETWYVPEVLGAKYVTVRRLLAAFS